MIKRDLFVAARIAKKSRQLAVAALMIKLYIYLTELVVNFAPFPVNYNFDSIRLQIVAVQIPGDVSLLPLCDNYEDFVL